MAKFMDQHEAGVGNKRKEEAAPIKATARAGTGLQEKNSNEEESAANGYWEAQETKSSAMRRGADSHEIPILRPYCVQGVVAK